MRKCFDSLFGASPGLAARGVTVACAVEVSPDGVVTQAAAENAAHPEVAACVQADVLTF